jgi:hypothetical protein
LPCGHKDVIVGIMILGSGEKSIKLPSTQTEAFSPSVLELAKKLHETAEGYVADASGNYDIDAEMDKVLKAALATEIAGVLSQLPPDEFLSLYESRLGNGDLVQAVKESAVIRQAEIERQSLLERISCEANKLGMLRLENVPQNEVITVGLFSDKPTQASYQFRAINKEVHFEHRRFTFRMIDPPTGYVELLRNDWVGDRTMHPTYYYDAYIQKYWRPLLSGNQRGNIGTHIIEKYQTVIEPYISIHSPLSYDFPESGSRRNDTFGEIVGYVVTRDGQLLLDGASVESSS